MSPDEILAMPECLLMAYHANLDRLRAERQLDAAQASIVPHLTEQGRSSWYRQAQQRVNRAIIAAPSAGTSDASGTTGPVLFTVDGRPVDRFGLARWLQIQFGGGLAGQASGTAAPTNGQGSGRVRP